MVANAAIMNPGPGFALALARVILERHLAAAQVPGAWVVAAVVMMMMMMMGLHR